MARRTRRATVVGRALTGALLVVTFASTGLLGAAAAPVPAPAPVAQVASGDEAPRVHRASAQDRATLAEAAEEKGEDTFLDVAPSCAASTRTKVKPNAVLYSTRKATFGWVLTSASGLRKTGTVKVKRESVAALKLPTLRTGAYRLVLTEKGASAPAADERFDVLRCVQVKTSCHAVRFTNPASNPAAGIGYGAGEEAFDLTLAPGEARTVRVDDKRIHFSAWSDDDAMADLGHRRLTVKQACKAKPAKPGQNAVQTSAVVGCGTATTTAPVTFSWVAQKSLKNRTFDVVDATSQVVAKGSFRGGRDATVRLAPGDYTYRSHANKKAQPFEQIAFTVLRCVEVTPVCQALKVQNPNDVAVEVAVIDPALLDDPDVDLGDDPEVDQLQELTLAAGSAGTVTWTRPQAWVVALEADADLSSRFLGFASPFPTDLGEDDDIDLDALALVGVPQDC